MHHSEEINEIVFSFETADLKELEQMRLLDRYDCKYIFPFTNLASVLKDLKSNYNVLKVNERRCFHYYNQYYDTADYALHRMHINGKRTRYKVRKRNYDNSNQTYFELKLKNNMGKTEKHRLPILNSNGHLNEDEINFLKKYNIDLLNLFPSVKVYYKRITLTNKNLPEKITIDFDIDFISSYKSQRIDGLVIAETKNLKNNNNTFFKTLMGEQKIEEYSISKYCTGAIYTIPDIKYNRYKPKILLINKICKETNGINNRI